MDTPVTTTMKRAVLIGDSITQAYEPFVREKLGGTWEVLGHGWTYPPGHVSHAVLARLDELVFDRHPDVVHLNTGLHDVMRSVATHRQNNPFEKYVIEVRQILERLKRESRARIIWATTTPVVDHRQLAKTPELEFVRFDSDIRELNAATKQIAASLGVEIDDLYDVVERGGRDRLLNDDGAHFTEEGNRVLARAVSRSLGGAQE